MTLLAATLLLGGNLFAAHPEARSEWWYYTGHLQTASGRPYGFELTFFRIRLDDGEDLDAAHFAVADIGRGRFLYDEKLHRPFPGIAGAGEHDLSVFNENWEARRENDRHLLKARMPGAEIELSLAPGKAPVFHGEGEISRKGGGENDYSHYVSLTRLAASGVLRENGRTESVSGTAWFDHEWGPGGIPENLSGWDWFSIQLSDDTELMLYRLRLAGGASSPYSSGTWIDEKGNTRTLRASDFQIESSGTWRSPHSGTTYPSVWTLHIPALDIALRVVPELADQELETRKSTRVTYWEGSCGVSGTRHGKLAAGKGYVELTGYAGRDVP